MIGYAQDAADHPRIVEIRAENNVIPNAEWFAGLSRLFDLLMSPGMNWEFRLWDVHFVLPVKGAVQLCVPDRVWPAPGPSPIGFTMPPTASWSTGRDFESLVRFSSRDNLVNELWRFGRCSTALRCVLEIGDHHIYLDKVDSGIRYTVALRTPSAAT